jgi:hypothetical protein
LGEDIVSRYRFWGILMTATADFFRSRLDGMVDQKHPLVVLSKRSPWAGIEQTLAPRFARTVRPGQKMLSSAPQLGSGKCSNAR